MEPLRKFKVLPLGYLRKDLDKHNKEAIRKGRSHFWAYYSEEDNIYYSEEEVRERNLNRLL